MWHVTLREISEGSLSGIDACNRETRRFNKGNCCRRFKTAIRNQIRQLKFPTKFQNNDIKLTVG